MNHDITFFCLFYFEKVYNLEKKLSFCEKEKKAKIFALKINFYDKWKC